MTKAEKEALLEEFRLALQAENKADIETVRKLILDRVGGEEIKALQEKIDMLETKMGRLPLSGMEPKKTEANPLPLAFVDDKGVEHKALRMGENLYSGKEEFSVGKILAAQITGSRKGLSDFEKKAISEGTGSAGGFLLTEEVSSRVYDLARNLMCVQRAGAITIDMPQPEMRLVKITGDPTAQWRAEHGAITESEWALEPVSLKAVSVGCLVRASKEILADAQNAGAALQNAMAQAIALALDYVALLGDGVTQPRGLDQCGDVNLISMGVNGAALTSFDEFSEAIEDVADNNGEASAVIYSPRTHFALDRLKAATTNQPLQPPQSFKDLKRYHTNQISTVDTQGSATDASKAFVGDFAQILFGVRQGLEVEMTSQGGTGTFAQVETLIRATMRVDVCVLRENFFSKIEGIVPA